MTEIGSFDFERSLRQTMPSQLAEDPEALFVSCCTASIIARDNLAFHYDDTRLSSTMPVWDNGSQSVDGSPVLKLLMAGNYKPRKEGDERGLYVRVCSEQNLIDNALRIGDTVIGANFLRAPNSFTMFEGVEEDNHICMCGNCRGRVLSVFGPQLVTITFRGDSLEPVEAITTQQQIEHYDFKKIREVVAVGKEVKEYFIEEIVKKGVHSRKIGSLPNLPSRMYTRPS